MKTLLTIFKFGRLGKRLWDNPAVQQFLVWRWWAWRYRKVEKIRFSISALIRIRVDDQYLLVKNREFSKYQPVGGVLKYYPSAESTLNDLGFLQDSMFKPNRMNRRDLRVQVPGKNLAAFLTWFDGNRDREDSPEREFREELFSSGILDAETFGQPRFNRLKRHIAGIHPCVHLDGQLECRLAEIYELVLTEPQERILRALIKQGNPRYLWADDAQIARMGMIPKIQVDANITDTSSWVV